MKGKTMRDKIVARISLTAVIISLAAILVVRLAMANQKAPKFMACPKCGQAIHGGGPLDGDVHYTPYAEGFYIFDMHASCWSNSSVEMRLAIHKDFMERYRWPQDKRALVYAATREGK